MIKTDNFKQKLLFWPQVPVQAISKQWKYNNLTSVFKDSPQMWYVRVESQKCECKSTNWEFNFTSYEFRSASYKFNFISYEFKSTSYEFILTSYEFSSTSYEFNFISYKFKWTSYKLNFTSYEFKFTSSLNQWKLNQTVWQTSQGLDLPLWLTLAYLNRHTNSGLKLYLLFWIILKLAS